MAKTKAAKSTVDWKALKTATGSASRVPAFVKALTAGKTKEDRDVAYYQLNKGLYAEGTLGPSAPATIPLLVETLASGKDGAHRAGWLIGQALTSGHERVITDPAAAINGPIGEVRAAVAACKDVLFEAIGSPDALVRAGAAFALAWAPELAVESRPQLLARVAEEPDDGAELSLLLALGLLGPSPEAQSAIAGASPPGPLGRGGRMLATLLVTPKAPFTAVANDLFGLLQTKYDRDAVPWCQGYDRLVVGLATRLKVREQLALALASALEPEVPPACKATVEALLELGGFKARWGKDMWQLEEIALPEELSDTQKAIATGLARQNGLWDVHCGVPRSGRDRRRWLGLLPPGPLEKRMPFDIDGTRHEWPVWKIWRTQYQRQPTEDLPPTIAAVLSPDEVLESLAEIQLGAYNVRVVRHSGGSPPSAEVVKQAVEKCSPKAAEWARRLADEVLPLVAARSVAELGGVIGMSCDEAVYLAILKHRGPIEPRWYPFIYPRRWLHEQLPFEQREAAVWAWMGATNQTAGWDDYVVSAVVPLLDLAPSSRIAKALLARHPTPEQLARIHAVAEKEPALAEGLAAETKA